jgi:hypothetical protein
MCSTTLGLRSSREILQGGDTENQSPRQLHRQAHKYGSTQLPTQAPSGQLGLPIRFSTYHEKCTLKGGRNSTQSTQPPYPWVPIPRIQPTSDGKYFLKTVSALNM